MKLRILLFLFFTFTKTICGQGNSIVPTAAAQEDSDQLNDPDFCLLDRYAEYISNLLVGENLNDELDSADNVDERMVEIDVFSRQIETIFTLATRGADNSDNLQAGPSRPDQIRVRYVSTRIVRRLIEIYYSTSSVPYREEISYRYNLEDRTFTYNHRIRDIPRNSLLSNQGDASSYEHDFAVQYQSPVFFLSSSRSRPFVVTHLGTTPDGVELVKHHIIPRVLIMKFLKLWLNNYRTTEPSSSAEFLDRVTIFHRLKQSIQKIMIYYIKKFHVASRETTINYDPRLLAVDDDYFFQAVESFLTNSAGGNIFIGPNDRGPLDPSYGTENDFQRALRAFEYNCEPIIGSGRYQEMHNLFNSLLNYVTIARTLSGLDRMTQGAELVITMVLTIERYGQTNYDESNWIRRTLRPKELSKVPKLSRRVYKTQKFSAIIESQDRSKRSLTDLNKLYPTEKCFSIEDYSKKQWSNFISDSAKNVLESQASGESVIWEHNFNELYFIQWFRSLKNESKDADCVNKNFDTYLYSKISKSSEWRECISFTEPKEPENWCQAWRRIMLNSDINNHWSNVKKPIVYHTDTNILLDWLSKKITGEHEEVKLSSKNIATKACYKFKNATSYSCNCNIQTDDNYIKFKQPERVIQSAPNEGLLSYSSTWYRNIHDDKLQCDCSTDTSNISNVRDIISDTLSTSFVKSTYNWEEDESIIFNSLLEMVLSK